MTVESTTRRRSSSGLCPAARGSACGQALVEFALASSILFMAIFGILSGGLSIYRYNMIADLAQEGARWGAVRGVTSPAAMQAQGTAAGILAQLQARNPGVPITVTVNANPNTLAAGASLSVTVNSTWLPVTSFVNLTAFQMSANAKMIMAR